MGKEIIFFKNSRFSEEKYDILEDEYCPTVLGISLPLPITVRYAVAFEEQQKTIDAEKARDLAKIQLTEKIRGVSSELHERSFYFKEEGQGLRAEIRAYCVMDIAKPAEVTTEKKEPSP